MKQIIGTKVGMTRIYDETGREHAITAVAVPEAFILDRRTEDRDGYTAYVVGIDPHKKRRPPTKARMGLFDKASVAAMRKVRELRLDSLELEVGAAVGADIFEAGDRVKVRGMTKGRGFQGVVKRYNFGGGSASHGHRCHRIPGSIGASATPSRVWPGQKLPGRMGGKQRTIKGLEILNVDSERGLLIIRGAVPGAPGGELLITTDERTAK